MKTPLFDVVISVSGTEHGTGIYDVTLIDTSYHPTSAEHQTVIGTSGEKRSLEAALDWAKGAVTAFMEGAQA